MLQNCEIEINDDLLIIKVDLRRELGVTNTGANVRIGTTEGNFLLWSGGKPHPKFIKMNLTVFRPLTQEEKKTGKWIPLDR